MTNAIRSTRYKRSLETSARLRQRILLLYDKDSRRGRQTALAKQFSVSRQRINQIVNEAASRARNKISKDVIYGLRVPARKLKCVDCGANATQYDHRDYEKKADVDPVCLPCHKKRGRGKNGKKRVKDAWKNHPVYKKRIA